MIEKDVQLRKKMANRVPHPFSAVDAFPAFVIQAVNHPDDTISAATLAHVNSTSMTFLVDAAAPTGKWAIGTLGVVDISAAANDTVGEFQDTVNGTLGYRMFLVGARRATTMASILAKSAADMFGANGLTFYFDASASDIGAVAISGEKFVNHGINGHQKDFDDKCINMLTDLDITVGLTGNGSLRIYSGKQGSTESLMHTFTMTDDTNIVKGKDQPLAAWEQAKEGERLIVEIFAATSFDDIAVCNINGKTAVQDGSRQVAEKNYS